MLNKSNGIVFPHGWAMPFLFCGRRACGLLL